MSLATARHPSEDISRDQLELLKAKFDVLQGERKVSPSVEAPRHRTWASAALASAGLRGHARADAARNRYARAPSI